MVGKIFLYMRNSNKKTLMISVIALLMICSTVTAGTGVWAAAQNVMQASDNISFVADPYVDAVFTDSVNTFTFESNKR